MQRNRFRKFGKIFDGYKYSSSSVETKPLFKQYIFPHTILDYILTIFIASEQQIYVFWSALHEVKRDYYSDSFFSIHTN